MPRAVVTGAAGFVGQWLCKALLQRGWEVSGTTIGLAPSVGILAASELASVQWRGIDLRPGRDRRTVRGLLERARPDAIFHLAAIAFQPAAGADPDLAYDSNVTAGVRLLDLLKEQRAAGVLDPAVLLVGSAAQYGRHDGGTPLHEGLEQRPRTFYAATKSAQEAFGIAAAHEHGVRVVAARSFNHSGRGQAPEFLLPSLVARARMRRRDAAAPLPIGNTAPVRDFLHVSDVVTAYISLVEKGRPGEAYNVCSGEAISVGRLAAEVLERAGVAAEFTPDPALQRAVDVPYLVGDHTKLTAATGWSPTRTRADLIDDLLNATP